MSKNYSKINVIELVSLCKKKDANAQKAIFDRYSPHVLTICRRYAGSEQDAEDLFIDGFARAFERIETFYSNTGAEFYSWLKTVVINNCLNTIKTNNQRQFFIVDGPLEEIVDNEEVDLFEDDFLPEQLTSAMQMLSPLTRTVFNMYAIDGFSCKEISTRMETSEDTVKTCLSKARKSLQKILLENRKV